MIQPEAHIGCAPGDLYGRLIGELARVRPENGYVRRVRVPREHKVAVGVQGLRAEGPLGPVAPPRFIVVVDSRRNLTPARERNRVTGRDPHEGERERALDTTVRGQLR